jgi:hypothetical protein
MYRRIEHYLLRDSRDPLSTLAGLGLLIMASSRLAFAIVTVGAILWVYGLSVVVVLFARPLLPKTGRQVVIIFLVSFISSLFLFLFWFICPLLAMGAAYLVVLMPCYCAGSSVLDSSDVSQKDDIKELLFRAFLEAGSLGVLILAFALIREPIGFMALSLPGGTQGIVELFNAADGSSFLPLRIISSSAGALILLGYGVAVFRGVKKAYSEGA